MISGIKEYYNELAKNYDENRFGNSYGKYIHQQEKEILEKYLSNENTLENLDLACGTGRFLEYAQNGIDLSPEMVKVAQSKFPEKNIQVQNACHLEFQNESFRNAFAFHLFMHLDVSMLKEILDETKRVLKTDGLFILDIPSAKRRKLSHYKSDNWHGGFQITVKDFKNLIEPDWELKAYYGIAFFPVHKIPKNLRNYFVKFDSLLGRSICKEFSSHLIFIIRKK